MPPSIAEEETSANEVYWKKTPGFNAFSVSVQSILGPASNYNDQDKPDPLLTGKQKEKRKQKRKRRGRNKVTLVECKPLKDPVAGLHVRLFFLSLH